VDVTYLGTVEGSGPTAVHSDSGRAAVVCVGKLHFDQHVRAYSLGNLTAFTKFPGSHDSRLVFSRTGELLAVPETDISGAAFGSWGIYGHLCNMETGKASLFRGEWNHGSHGVQGSRLAAFSPNGYLLALCRSGLKEIVYIVDAASAARDTQYLAEKASTTFVIRRELTAKSISSTMALEWSPSGEFLAQVVGAGSVALRLWKLTDTNSAAVGVEHFGTIELPESLGKGDYSPSGTVAFAADSALIAVGGSRSVPLRLIDVKGLRIAHSTPYDGSKMTALAFAPGGKYLLSGDSDGTLCLWELSSGDSGVSLNRVDGTRLPGPILALSISSQGSSAIVANKRDKGSVDLGRVRLPSDAAEAQVAAAATTSAPAQTAAPAEAVAEMTVERAVAAPVWSPTHLVPAAGMPFWAAPDSRLPPAGQLAANFELVVIASAGVWVQVTAANGWRGWVDGRLLVSRR